MAEAAASGSTVLSRLSTAFAGWIARRSREEQVWRDAATLTSGQVWVRPEEPARITSAVQELVEEYQDRSGPDRPDGARRVRFALIAFPGDPAPPASS